MRPAQVKAELKAGHCGLAYDALSPGRALLARKLTASAAWRKRLDTAKRAIHGGWGLHDAILEALDAADVGSPSFDLRALFYSVRDAWWAQQVRRSARLRMAAT